MVRLILAGGGDEKQSKVTDEFYLSKLGEEPKILFIPIALKGIKDFNDCYSWISGIFTNTKIEMLTDFNQECDLNKYDTVYISGGNTYNLLEELNNSKFKENLVEFAKNNSIVYGGSAGAIILGKNILTSGDEDHTNLEDYSGINLIDGYSIWPHYRSEDEEEIKEYISEFDEGIIAIPEESSLYVEDDQVWAVGEKNVVIYKNINWVEILEPNKKTFL